MLTAPALPRPIDTRPAGMHTDGPYVDSAGGSSGDLSTR